MDVYDIYQTNISSSIGTLYIDMCTRNASNTLCAYNQVNYLVVNPGCNLNMNCRPNTNVSTSWSLYKDFNVTIRSGQYIWPPPPAAHAPPYEAVEVIAYGKSFVVGMSFVGVYSNIGINPNSMLAAMKAQIDLIT